MADLISMLAAAAGSGGPTDPDFNQTVLLLHGDGTNGAQNNTFLDGSTNNFTITRNGNTTQGTFSPFSGPNGYWSNYFDGSGDYLVPTGNASNFAFGTGDFTIEMWIYVSVLPGSGTYNIFYDSRDGEGAYPTIGLKGSTIVYYVNSADRITSSTVSASTWYHLAISRSGTSTKMFLNGAQTGSTYTDNTNYLNTGSKPVIGADKDGTSPLNGYISNIRVLKGTAQYTGAYTVPTTPLTNITNTSLLTCQSNRFVDNATTPSTITRNGDVKVTPFSPFAPTAAYSASTNGGSGYFDGTGDSITIADNAAFTFGSGDFSIECFLYQTANNISYYVSQNTGTASTSSFDININNLLVGATIYYGSNFVALSGGTINLNEWNHVVFARTGTTLSLFLNGTRTATNASAGVTINDVSTSVRVSGINAGTTYDVTGYISNVRIIKGSGPYDATQTTITVPTAPPTPITNTSLLCNFTNAGIFDNTGKNNLETVGNAQIDTTTKKFGTGSMEFDGTTDYLFIPNDANNTLGTGDYTIEFWVYANSWTSTPVLVEYGRASNGSTPGLEFYISNTSGKLDIYGGSTTGTLLVSAGTNISTGSWTHVALTRASGSTKLFLNGTQTGSTATDTTNYTQATIFIGAYFAGGLCLNGFIDDFRVTKGVARYTSNFTPPTAAFPNE